VRLQGKVTIVTGGGYGIGEAISLRFAEEGAAVIVAELNADHGKRVAAKLAETGYTASFVQTDVADREQIRACVAFAVHKYGRLDVLVNNAGVNFVRPTLEVTSEDWDAVIAVDLRGTFFFCQQALRHMVEQRAGAIINISSVHTQGSLAGAAPYAAAKGGVSAMTRALAVEFGPLGIRINAVCPGLTATAIWQDIMAAAPHPEAAQQHWFDHIALARAQEPREVANTVLFLASDEASYVTGAEIFTDGGMTAMLTQRERFSSQSISGLRTSG